jgi:hypothetical protein
MTANRLLTTFVQLFLLSFTIPLFILAIKDFRKDFFPKNKKD